MRWVLSWSLFWVGDVFSRVMVWPLEIFLCPLYVRVMTWSDAVQGDGPGPWTDVDFGGGGEPDDSSAAT